MGASPTRSFACDGCGLFCDLYMVKPEVWQATRLPVKGALLCLTCLEAALDRALTIEDFTGAPINRAIHIAYRMGVNACSPSAATGESAMERTHNPNVETDVYFVGQRVVTDLGFGTVESFEVPAAEGGLQLVSVDPGYHPLNAHRLVVRLDDPAAWADRYPKQPCPYFFRRHVRPMPPSQWWEVTGFGYDGATDATDDRVFWVLAECEAQVQEVVTATGAQYQRLTFTPATADFALPGDSDALRQRLLQLQLQLEG